MESIKLSDEQMRGFIRDGYLLFQPDLPPEFHEQVFERTATVLETEGNPGNKILARIPAIKKAFDDPAVRGALEGVLGPGYYMHPHRHCHSRPPRGDGQELHKDGFSRRRHHTRWILAMYYPQETTVDMGPTAVVPGSQYYNTEAGSTLRAELPLPVPAGTVAIANYDIWHRGLANATSKDRFMMKFLFLRMEEPRGPSWDSVQREWAGDGAEGEAVWSGLLRWHLGSDDDGGRRRYAGDRSVSDLVASLVRDPEPECIDAAYKLGEIGQEAVPALLSSLASDHGPVEEAAEVSYGSLAPAGRAGEIRRNLSYALAAVGGTAVPGLMEAAEHRDWWVRDTAVETLGDIGLPAAGAVDTLAKAVGDESRQVRRHAAEAQGTAGQSGSAAVSTLVDTLGSEDTVLRRNGALALARIGENAVEAAPALASVLDDGDRYVRGKALEALYRIGTPEAHELLIQDLSTSRWCEITTTDDLY